MRLRGSRQDFMRALADLPAVLAGRLPDRGGAVEGLKLRMGSVLMARIREAYVTKARGGTDAMGIAWAPLSPVTLALRRIVASPKAVARARERYRNLSPERRAQVDQQAAGLRGILVGTLARERQNALRILQAKYRKNVVSSTEYTKRRKALSRELKIDEAAKLIATGAQAEILRDTGRLLNSLGPSIGSDMILRSGPGWLEVGTNVDYAKYHNSREPRKLKADGMPRLPRRQILPDSLEQVPLEWRNEMVRALASGLRSSAFWTAYLGGMAA